MRRTIIKCLKCCTLKFGEWQAFSACLILYKGRTTKVSKYSILFHFVKYSYRCYMYIELASQSGNQHKGVCIWKEAEFCVWSVNTRLVAASEEQIRFLDS